jgi:hypothetical protein
MLDPKTLCDTYTLFQEVEFDPDNPFDDVFDPDDPFGEGEEEENGEEEEEPEEDKVIVLTKVRLSQSSGDRAVDAQGDKNARQAILFFRKGVSRADGSLDIPEIKEGDKLAEGTLTQLPTEGKIWTVKGVIPLKSRDRLHHLEVSLV